MVAVLGALSLTLSNCLAAIDGLTAKMHLSGDKAGSLSSFAFSPTHPGRSSAADLRALVGSWHAFGVGTGSRDARALGHLYWTLDIAFGLLWAALLVGLVYWLRSRGAGREPVLQSLLHETTIFVPVAIAFAMSVGADIWSRVALDALWNRRTVWSGTFTAVWALGVLKWLAIVAVLIPVAVEGGLWVWSHADAVMGLWLQLLFVGAFFVLVGNDQVVDLVRGWNVGDWLWAGLATAVLGFVLALSGSSVLTEQVAPVRRETPQSIVRPPSVVRPAWRWIATLVMFILAGVAYASPWPGLTVPCLIVALVDLLSVPIERTTAEKLNVADPRKVRDRPARQWALSALAVVPLLILWRAGVTANTADALYQRRPGTTVSLIAAFLLVVVSVLAAGPLALLVDWMADHPGHRRKIEIAVVVVLASAAVAFHTDWGTYHLGPSLGGMAVLGFFLAEVLAAGVALRLLGGWLAGNRVVRPWVVPPPVRVLRIERPPLIGLLVLWAVIAPFVDPGHYHEARILKTNASWTPKTIDQIATTWSNGHASTGTARVLFVSASGGGIRAAYWTSAVLTCLLERDPTPTDPCGASASGAEIARRRATIFEMSGISGSSLGLVSYLAHETSRPKVAGSPWYRSALDHDFLTPTVTRWFFGDVPNVWLRSRSGDDRAAVLEQAWEHAWGNNSPLAAPFLTSQSVKDSSPLVILNGYAADSGCRINVSLLQSNGGRGATGCSRLTTSPAAPAAAPAAVLDATTDVTDYLACKQTQRDVRLSTAALLSARFPYVTPSGRLDTCDGQSTTFSVDGGYRDTSAASTITESWDAIEPALHTRFGPKIAPVFVQIDNGYAESLVQGQAGRPSELTVPLQARKRAMGGVADAARESAQRIFGRGFVEISTLGHPGTEAPLGWTLSPSSRADLDRQLDAVADQLDQARCLIDPATAGC